MTPKISSLPKDPYLAAFTKDEAPVADAAVAERVAYLVGPGRIEADDAALGLWLVDLSPELRRELRERGVIDRTFVGGYRVVVEMP